MKAPKVRTPTCEFGNSTVKAEQGLGGLHRTEAHMQTAIKTPCAECPLRRDSTPGYLGGYTPEMYIVAMFSPASIACHLSPGFDARDISTQRHCTGVAAFRANVGYLNRVTIADQSTMAVGNNREMFFATIQEFVDHHKKGQKP